MRGYLDIRTVPDQRDLYEVWVRANNTEAAVLQSGNTVGFNRQAVGLKVGKKYRPPTGLPAQFNRSDAIHIAHLIGNYIFGMGDLVFSYTTVDGRPNSEFFNS